MAGGPFFVSSGCAARVHADLCFTVWSNWCGVAGVFGHGDASRAWRMWRVGDVSVCGLRMGSHGDFSDDAGAALPAPIRYGVIVQYGTVALRCLD